MATAKVRTLTVRPIQSADLSFNLAGVLDYRNSTTAQLGARLPRFDPTNIYSLLSAVNGDGRFEFDGSKIRAALLDELNVALYGVRNQTVESALVHAICRRQNAFLRRYKHRSAIISEYESLYPQSAAPDSKLGRLAALRQRSAERHSMLADAYRTADRDGIIAQTETTTNGQSVARLRSEASHHSESVSTSSSKSDASSTAKGVENSTSTQEGSGSATTKQRPMAYRTQNQVTRFRDGNDPAGEVKQRVDSEDSKSVPLHWDGAWKPIEERGVSFEAQETTSNNEAKTSTKGESESNATSKTTGTSEGKSNTKGEQTSSSATDSSFSQSGSSILTEFQHPSADNDLRWLRRELELQDERLAQRLLSLQVPHMGEVLDNELTMLDQEVRQLQLTFLHTFLTSPISGMVTAIYKDLGESVGPGEPVLRVEDDSEILVVGVVNHRSPLRIGIKASITIENPFESPQPVPPIEIDGVVVAVRGHVSDNDEWDIIIRADNTVIGDPLARRLPLNYAFQREDVSLVFG